MGNIFLGAKLKELRTKIGYTQQQVADYIGAKNKSTVASWESGKSEPDAASLISLCSLYKVPSIKDVASSLGFNNLALDIENSPVPGKPETEEKIQERIKLLTDFFVGCGFIKEGGDISDNDLKFSMSLINLIDTYFNK